MRRNGMLNNRYDRHLWEFCHYDFEEIKLTKLSEKLEIDYGVLSNWWKASRHGRKSPPTLPPRAYEKLMNWATYRGYDISRQYDPII